MECCHPCSRNLYSVIWSGDDLRMHHSCSNPSVTNTSVAAVRTSGFRLSVFRFLVSPPFPWYTHPQCLTHPVYHLQLQRESGRTYSWSVVSSVVSKSTNISFSSVIRSAKMVANISAVFTEYEERVRRLQKVPRFSHGRRMVRSEQGLDPFHCNHIQVSVTCLLPLPRTTYHTFPCDHL